MNYIVTKNEIVSHMFSSNAIKIHALMSYSENNTLIATPSLISGCTIQQDIKHMRH